MMRRFRENPFRSWLGWALLFPLNMAALFLLLCQFGLVEPRQDMLTPDHGIYAALNSAPHARNSATLAQAITDMGTTRRRLFLTRGAWNLTDNHTIPATAPLLIPEGTTVTIAANKTLTLAACPVIEAMPGWLVMGSGARVNITAPGCPIRVEKFATGGTGTLADPWTGWDTALTWTSGATHGTAFATATARAYTFTCGVYKQVAMIALPGHFNTIQGATAGGFACTVLTYEPTGSADGDGYYTAWTIGNTFGEGGVWYHRFENIWLVSTDLTKKKRGLYFVDAREVTVRNVWITGNANDCGGAIAWCDTVDYGSTALVVRGREFIKVEDTHIFANHPVYLAGTPAVYGFPYTNGIDHNLDVTSMHNIEFVQIPLTHPTDTDDSVIQFDPDVFLTNFVIDGTCSLIGGKHTFMLDQSARSSVLYQASHTISINNCRPEGFETNDYRWVIKGLGGITVNNWQALLHSVSFNHVVWGGGGRGQGFYLKDVAYVKFDSMIYENTNDSYDPTNLNVGVHLDEAAFPVTFINSWLPNQTFMEVTGKQCMVFNSGKNSRLGPMGGAALVVFDVIDAYADGGCPQVTTPDGTPPVETGPVVDAAIPFTVHIEGTGGGVDATYTDRSGYWTRSGKLVHVYMRVNLSAKGTGTGLVTLTPITGSPSVGNLPPPPTNTTANFNQGLTVHYANVNLPTFACITDAGTNPQPCRYDSGTSATVTGLSAYIPPGQKNVLFRYMGNAVPDGTYLSFTDLTNTSVLEISGTYITEE